MRSVILLPLLLSTLARAQSNTGPEEAGGPLQSGRNDQRQPLPQGKAVEGDEVDESGQEEASDQEDDRDDADIIIDPSTPVARVTWVHPGHPKRFDDFNRPVPSGSNYTLAWNYTGPVLRPPRTLTLYRTRKPQASSRWLQSSDWTEIVTFPYKSNQRELTIAIGSQWLEGSSYFFRLRANYEKDLANNPGTIVNGATSAGLTVYHRSTSDLLFFASGTRRVSSWVAGKAVQGALAVLLVMIQLR